jgi:hypothetical protein
MNVQVGLININTTVNVDFNINFNIKVTSSTQVDIDKIKEIPKKPKMTQVVLLIGLIGVGKSRIVEVLTGKDGLSGDGIFTETMGFTLHNLEQKPTYFNPEHKDNVIDFKNPVILIDSQGCEAEAMPVRTYLKAIRELDQTIGGIDKVILTLEFRNRIHLEVWEKFKILYKYIKPWRDVCVLVTKCNIKNVFDAANHNYSHNIIREMRLTGNPIGFVDMCKEEDAAYSQERINYSREVIRKMIEYKKDVEYKIDYPNCTIL